MYKRQQKGWAKHLDFIILDLLCLCVSYALAYWLRNGNLTGLVASRFYINIGVVLIIIDLLVILLFNTMHNILRRGMFREFIVVVQENLLLFGFTTIYLFTVKDSEQLSRIMLWTTVLLHILTSHFAFLGWKRLIRRRHHTEIHRSMLLVADRDMAREVIRRFRNNPAGTIEITGLVLADTDFNCGRYEGIPIVCDLDTAPHYICREWIDEVYICTATPPQYLIYRCNEMGVTIHRELHTAGGSKQFVEEIADKYVLTSSMNAATPMEVFFKRGMDIVGGVVGSILALIIMAVVGPRIRKASPGPILFKQERIGKNGKRFKMYNLRSMQPLVI